jgi:nucleoid DNA-binding protein
LTNNHLEKSYLKNIRRDNNMTKADLVKMISEETGILRKDTAIVVDSFLEAVKESLQDGNHIELRGFGTFKLKVRKPRNGRNPKTGVTVPVPERVVPTFKFTKAVKEEISKINPQKIKK